MSLCALAVTRPTVVTLRSAAGEPIARWTLEREEREGRVFRWTPEGQLHTLGSGAGFRRRWVHRGWRRELIIRWDVGQASVRQPWTGSAWGPGVMLPTAEAVAEIHQAVQVEVDPLQGSEFGTYLAQTFEHELVLRDMKGVVHTQMELLLRAEDLVDEIQFIALDGFGWTSWGYGPWGN